MEVHQQPALDSRKLQVREHLRVVYGEHLGNSLYLNNELVVDDHIQPVTDLDSNSFVDHRQGYLSRDRQSRFDKLVSQAAFVG